MYLHSKILHSVDIILFSLLILRGLRDSQGNMWRCLTSQLYAVEVTKYGNQVSKRTTFIHVFATIAL